MKKAGRLALIAALAFSSTAPVMAQSAAATRPAVVSYAAPTAEQFGSTLTGGARAMKKTGKKSQLIGGGGFLIALLTALSGLLGYSSLQAFIGDLQDGILGNSPK